MTPAARFEQQWGAGRRKEALATARAALDGATEEQGGLAHALIVAVMSAMHEPDPDVGEAAELAAGLFAAALGDADDEVWKALALLASVHREHGRFDRAEEAARRALAVAERQRNKKKSFVERSLTLLGDVQREAGRMDEAEQSFRAELAVLERAGRAGAPEAARPLAKLAVIATARGRLDDAEKLIKRQLALRAPRSERPRALDDALLLGDLAKLQARQGKVREAFESGGRAVALLERLGRDDPDTAEMSAAVGQLFVELGRPAAALPLLRRAHDVLRRTRGVSAPAVLRLAALIAELAGAGDGER